LAWVVAIALVASLISCSCLAAILLLGGEHGGGGPDMMAEAVAGLKEANARLEERLHALERDGLGGYEASSVSYRPADERPQQEAGQDAVVAIADKVIPAVVCIQIVGTVQRGRNQTRELTTLSEGSGVIFRGDGYIVTNHHVVEYAIPDSQYNAYYDTSILVLLSDGREAIGEYVGGDRYSDIAVVKIDLPDLPVAELGDSDALKVGELAVAIGNPLGAQFAGSVTAGIISALNREVSTGDVTLSVIQTDAAINPGNSGGALLNSKGELIGINSVKMSETGVEGMGFAIPINDVKPLMEQIMEYGYVKGRPGLGMSGYGIGAMSAMIYGYPAGVYVESLSADGGAAKAGVRVGDIIVSLAGEKVEGMQDINVIKAGYKAGDTVKVGVVRVDDRTGRYESRLELDLTFSEDRG